MCNMVIRKVEEKLMFIFNHQITPTITSSYNETTKDKVQHVSIMIFFFLKMRCPFLFLLDCWLLFGNSDFYGVQGLKMCKTDFLTV